MDISALRERRGNGIMTVSDLNNYIKSSFDADRLLKAVTISGEISNFTKHTTGHLYFSLKDETSQIKAIMFRSAAERLPFIPENGMKVTVSGTVSVYVTGGTYSISAYSIQPLGVGALYFAYEQLKSKLSAEGLFDELHKRPIPKMPEKIGVITSSTGAAVRDIINVTGRRFPLAQIYLYPALVQGDGAEASLIEALDYFEASKLCDVIIIGRGGGSIEDLWAFNSEALARRIYSASVPIISAVGHETDFTICDFVADLRAPTPSAAAEISVPDIKELYIKLDSSLERCRRALEKTVSHKREGLKKISENKFILHPELIAEKRKEETERCLQRLQALAPIMISNKKNELISKAHKLEALNPLSILTRGFAVPEINGKRIYSAEELQIGDRFSLIMSDGRISATVKDKQ